MTYIAVCFSVFFIRSDAGILSSCYLLLLGRNLDIKNERFYSADKQHVFFHFWLTYAYFAEEKHINLMAFASISESRRWPKIESENCLTHIIAYISFLCKFVPSFKTFSKIWQLEFIYKRVWSVV